MNTFTPIVLLTAGLLLGASFAKAQTAPVYQTVSIIGSATAAGWGADTPMRLVMASDPHNWTVVLPLTAGPGNSEVKFRANNDWSVNWGATAFPTGTGTANGPNVIIPAAGIYTVQFNDVSGTYRFTAGALASKASSSSALALYPNPTSHAATLSGVAAGTTVQVYDAVGRLALTTTVDATGAATLALPTGLYVVRSGFGPALWLAVD
jgi:hypothetical protein